MTDERAILLLAVIGGVLLSIGWDIRRIADSLAGDFPPYATEATEATDD